MTDPHGLLAQASVVALVDWPRTDVPRTLVRAGFGVYSLNRLRRTAASYAWYPSRDQVPEGDDVTVFDATDEADGYLVCRPAAPPETVDILTVYRPARELPGLARLAVQLGAKALWLEPGSVSPEARRSQRPGALRSSRASTSPKLSAQPGSRSGERGPRIRPPLTSPAKAAAPASQVLSSSESRASGG
jgi:predicted CoA-binding protein